MCCGSKCHTVRLQNWELHQEKPHKSLEQQKSSLIELKIFFVNDFFFKLFSNFNKTIAVVSFCTHNMNIHF